MIIYTLWYSKQTLYLKNDYRNKVFYLKKCRDLFKVLYFNILIYIVESPFKYKIWKLKIVKKYYITS